MLSNHNNDILFLQKAYVGKYFNKKYVNELIHILEHDYIKWLNTEGNTDYIVNKDVDMIIFLITKEQFFRIIRSALILMNIHKEERPQIINILKNKHNLQKKQLITEIEKLLPSFLTYFVISLYAYI
uniref:Uncharacterized protein n=1 Tax=viral metagenome TaxID=1070528 RepID=A0A6C0BQW5_9ZZZZ